MVSKEINILDEIAKLRGFKGRKRIEKNPDKTVKIIDLSPTGEWAEFHAKKLGFEGRKKGDRIGNTVVDKDVTPIEEFTEYIKNRTGTTPDNVYMLLIPQSEISQGLDILKQKWLLSHQKFIDFCGEFAKQIEEFFLQNKKENAAIKMEDMFKVMEDYHVTHPGSMNIYSRDDLVIGLGHCLPEKGINARMTANKRAIIFEKIQD